MFRADARRAFRLRRRHSSLQSSVFEVLPGEVLEARHLTACFWFWQAQVMNVFAWQGVISLQG
jgi:hypothetical protein